MVGVFMFGVIVGFRGPTPISLSHLREGADSVLSWNFSMIMAHGILTCYSSILCRRILQRF